MAAARPLLALLLLLAPGCGFTTKVLERSNGFGGRPLRELPEVSEVPVKGFQVTVEYQGAAGQEELEGELLAVDRKFIWIKAGPKVRRVPLPDVATVNLELYPSRAGWLGLWFGAGTAASASHGVYAAVSGPLWLLTGLTSTITAATANDIDVPLDRLPRLAQFARYPAGMPPPWVKRRAPRPLPASAPAPASRPASLPTTRPASLPTTQPASAPASRPRPPAVDEPGML